MSADIRVLDAADIQHHRPALSEVLADCVNGGASVSFMLPFAPEDAHAFWDRTADAVARKATVLLVAEAEGAVVATVQLGLDMPPNQPHRGDIKKLLVHRAARRRGLGAALMTAAEDVARSHGRTLLVLDTATGSEAEQLYPRLGWQKVGMVPDYAHWPDGRPCGTTFFYKRLT